MRQEALVDGEESFRLDRLAQTIKHALVQVTVLVIQSGHDGI